MVYRPDFIIIGSTGRNTGKTEFASRLIAKHSKERTVYGVKVVTIDPDEGNCPRGGKGCGVCTSLEGDYEITEEAELIPGKDTTRMLQAGAQRVFFLKVSTHSLERGLKALIDAIPENVLTVCESNSIRKVMEPGIFLVIKNLNEKGIKESCAEVINMSDRVVDFRDMDWNFSPDRVRVKDNQWIIREAATAIILAGGKSSRMGGSDKSLLPVNGVPLIAYIAEQLEGHFDEIIIGANEPDKYPFLNHRIVADMETDKGPLMGIYSCLTASASEINFVTACDIPEMNIRLIRQMINLSDEADIVMPVGADNKHEPLFAVYRKSVAVKAREILDRGGRRIIELLDHVIVKYVDFNDNGWYQNLNHREEYTDYVQRTGNRKCDRD